MPSFLSPAWIAALDDAARAVDGLPDDSSFSVGQRITDGAAYRLVVEGGRARIESGEEAADVVLVVDEATARAIHTGRANVQETLSSGRCTVLGDVAVLMAHADDLAKLAPALSSVPSD